MNCLGCSLVNNLIKIYQINESINFRIILDIDPINPGHLLIIPKKHFEKYHELSADLLIELQQNIKTAQMVLSEKLDYKDFTILINEGTINDLNQHLHIHIIPRKKSDQLEYSISKLKTIDLIKIFKKLT